MPDLAGSAPSPAAVGEGCFLCPSVGWDEIPALPCLHELGFHSSLQRPRQSYLAQKNGAEDVGGYIFGAASRQRLQREESQPLRMPPMIGASSGRPLGGWLKNAIARMPIQ
ncbi:hypothetical protein, partial [Dyella sp.]|uniref:hypothetical protein n=1 Tax=Dyella sp. TaxID=1869338 RepID=UPI002B49863F